MENWQREDWEAFWNERAAIYEYDGGLPRKHAEMAASQYVIALRKQLKKEMEAQNES